MSSIPLATAQGRGNELRRWLPLVCLWAAILLAYFDTGRAMVAIWSRSDTFAHAFLVPPISAWLVWRRRDVLARIDVAPNAWMLLPLGVAALVWLLGDLSATNAMAQFALVAMCVLAVPIAMGLPFAHALMFPLGFLFFAVPFGDFLMPQLMEGTANFTVAALQLSGIPVYREGLQFVIPSGNWSVVEACSGVRYLIASVMVGTLFAYLNYRSMRRRLVFIAVSIVVPVVANWLRAYMIVMLGHLSSNTLAVGADHLIYGWVFFGVVIMLMFMIGARWSEPDELDAPTGSAASGLSSVPRPAAVHRFAAAPSVIAAAMLLLAAPHLALWNIHRIELDDAPPELALPATLGDRWVAQPKDSVDWKPAYSKPSAEASRSYASGERVVGVYVGYYRRQDYERKLVSSYNELVRSNDKVWARVSSALLDTPRSSGSGTGSVTVKASVLRNTRRLDAATDDGLLVWQVYWINGVLTSNEAWARLVGAAYKVLGRGDDAAVIMVYTESTRDDAAASRLQAFVRDNLDAIDGQLRVTRERRRELAQPGGTAPIMPP